MQTTKSYGQSDALIPEQRQSAALQSGVKFRWGEELEQILSRPQSRNDESREHGYAFVGGWLSFAGQLTKS